MNEKPQVNGDFVTEGTFLALRVGFPGVSCPPEAPTSRLHRLCLSPGGHMVYAATRGPKPRVVQFAPKGTFGYSVGLMCFGEEEIKGLVARPGKRADDLLVMLVGTEGTRLVCMPAAQFGHGIQEWHVVKSAQRGSLELRGFSGIDLSLSPDGGTVAALGDGCCLLLDWLGDTLTLRRDVEIRLPAGRIFARSEEDFAWVNSEGDGGKISLGGDIEVFPTLVERRWTVVAPTFRGVICADADGEIWEWIHVSGRWALRGRIPMVPVRAVCLLRDGRIFAFAGESIAHWHVLDSTGGWARDLGVAVSTLSARRYGLEFADLLPGRDGEIYAAEDDQGGHLWVYFPPSYIA